MAVTTHPKHVNDESAAELTRSERQVAVKRTALRAAVIHEAIRSEGEGELRRPVSALTWSGLAAGLSMGFSLVATGLMRDHLPDTNWRPLVVNLGYSVGFLIAILGRQQLYTENTLTVMLPVMIRRDFATGLQVARLWSVVLTANLAGACAFAWVLAKTDAFRPEVQSAFAALCNAGVEGDFGTLVLRGIFAGWLIAMMVWMMPAADSARVTIIIIMTYLVALAGLPHSVAGSVEGAFMGAIGRLTWSGFLIHFLAPTVIGNTIGGVSLVAFFNHAQVVTDDTPQAD